MQRKGAISEKQCEDDLKRFAKLAVKMGAVDAKPIDTKNVFVEDWVRLKCQYGCGSYGKSLTCPPYSPTPEQMRRALKGYSRAILMRLPDESMTTHDMVAKLERHVFLEGYYSALGLPAGPCERCKKCNLKYCIYPRLARASMEACGHRRLCHREEERIPHRSFENHKTKTNILWSVIRDLGVEETFPN